MVGFEQRVEEETKAFVPETGIDSGQTEIKMTVPELT